MSAAALIDQIANAIGSADIGAPWTVNDYPKSITTERYRKLARGAISALLNGKSADPIPAELAHHIHFDIKPEVYGGTHILEAARANVALANRLGVGLWFDFNGVSVLARVGDDPKRIEEAWETALANKWSHAATR